MQSQVLFCSTGLLSNLCQGRIAALPNIVALTLVYCHSLRRFQYFALQYSLSLHACSISVGLKGEVRTHVPILEPNLHRSLGHINILSDSFSNKCGRCWILIKLDLQRHKLILRRPLALLISLLLGLVDKKERLAYDFQITCTSQYIPVCSF